MIDVEPWQPACAEYFRDFAEGRFDEAGQFWFVEREADIQISADRGDLTIGRAGCDGVEFCYRRGMSGVWAHYPIENQHLLVAPDLRAFETGWRNGSITV